MIRKAKDGDLILAKSEPQVSLSQHIEDCLQVCRQLQVCVPNLPIENKPEYWKIVGESVILHDTGKAHNDFQRMLSHKPNQWNHQRHELFSLYFVYNSEIPDEEKEKVLFVVAGHHKSLSELTEFVERNYSGDDWDEDGLRYEEECSKLPIEQISKLLDHYEIKVSDCDIPEVTKIIRRFKKRCRECDDGDRLLYTLLVGAMRQCDHMASAGINKLERLETCDFSHFHDFTLYAHQKEDSQASGNVILNAPTGSGKTESAMLWLEHQLKDKGQGRAYYILPYTASINAMYERLTECFDREKVGILHGRLSEYLEANMDGNSCEVADIRKQVEEFKSMVAPIKIVTPFQLLKTLFGLKGFEKGIFEWSGGYFIFDEIHAYDVRTFAQIMVLLHFATEKLGVHVHVMTATLPSFMRQELANVINPYANIMADEALYKRFTRHKVILKEGKLSDNLCAIQDQIDKRMRVLVVCNTVDEAQYVYQHLDANEKVLLHGRFNSEDRFEKEKRLKSESVNLLVGTQAIEISLNIDFDVLFTEPAPLDALLQRFGRINRRRLKGICDCHVYKERNDADKYIYSDNNVIERTLDVLSHVSEGGIINEAEISSAMDFVYPQWSVKAKEDYDTTKTLLEHFISNRLRPLEYEEQNEKDFYQQFDGCKVLPSCLTELFQDRLNTNRLIKADSLMVNITTARLKMCLSKGDIQAQAFAYQVGESIKTRKEYVINKKYTHELGLEFGQTGFLFNEDNFL